MACFWKGILYLLNVTEINHILGTHFAYMPQPKEFVEALKANNMQTIDIKHNNINLTGKEIIENFEHIKALDSKTVYDGYLCSGFEPVLFLISQLFGYNIKHIFCDVPIYYTHPEPKGELIFGSNESHFYSISKGSISNNINICPIVNKVVINKKQPIKQLTMISNANRRSLKKKS